MRQREPRERDPAYLGWIAGLPCAACLAIGRYRRGVQVAHLRAPSEAHGKRYTGKAEKPHDRWTLPLCQPHHTGDKRAAKMAQHDGDEVEFWQAHHIDPFDLCLELNAAFADLRQGAPVITKHIAIRRRAA